MTAITATGLIRRHRPLKWRRNGQVCPTPMDTFNALSASVVLERIPVAALAIDRGGAILFANTAFAALVGFTLDALRSVSLPQIIRHVPVDESVAENGGGDTQVIALTHADGWTVQARMNKATLGCAGEAVILATFDDLTEKLWMSGP